ncbi:MAG: YraN family protein [Pseudomonadota bacterium]
MSFDKDPLQTGAMQKHAQHVGARSHFRGISAEHIVARYYEDRGAQILERRFRGTAGEIDLIVCQSEVVIFCEVKASKDKFRAAASLSKHQQRRLCQTAEEFLGTLPDGQLTEMRFDLAVVDAQGMPEILQNAFGQE